MTPLPSSNIRYFDVHSAELHHRPAGQREPLDVAVPINPQTVSPVDLASAFAELGDLCVPEFCDSCCVDFVEGGRGQHVTRLSEFPGPHSETTEGAGPGAHSFQVRFSLPAHGAGRYARADGDSYCTGTATFHWYYRAPQPRDRFVLTLLVDNAVHTAAWQRTAADLLATRTKIEDLQAASNTSRQIGIAVGVVMNVYELLEDQAFDLLRAASVRSDRTLLDVATEIIGTGRLVGAT